MSSPLPFLERDGKKQEKMKKIMLLLLAAALMCAGNVEAKRVKHGPAPGAGKVLRTAKPGGKIVRVKKYGKKQLKKRGPVRHCLPRRM